MDAGDKVQVVQGFPLRPAAVLSLIQGMAGPDQLIALALFHGMQYPDREVGDCEHAYYFDTGELAVEAVMYGFRVMESSEHALWLQYANAVLQAPHGAGVVADDGGGGEACFVNSKHWNAMVAGCHGVNLWCVGDARLYGEPEYVAWAECPRCRVWLSSPLRPCSRCAVDGCDTTEIREDYLAFFAVDAAAALVRGVSPLWPDDECVAYSEIGAAVADVARLEADAVRVAEDHFHGYDMTGAAAVAGRPGYRAARAQAGRAAGYGGIAVAVLAAAVGRLVAHQRLDVGVRSTSFGVRSLHGVRSFGERPDGG
jgi:hypothetical protein